VTGEIDLSTPTGRLVARTLGAAARHESEHKSERMRRARLQAAEQGRPHPSGQRGYGYAADRITIIDQEAEVVREAATRILAGESQGSVAADLNGRGIPTATGKQYGLPELPQDDCWLDMPGAAAFTGVPPKTITSWLTRGGPARNPFPDPRRLLYRLYWRWTEVAAWQMKEQVPVKRLYDFAREN